MRVLLDTCVSNSAAFALEHAGHDVRWAGDPPDPGDDALLAAARDEGRVLITLDKDFGELAIVHRVPHCGIVRLAGLAVSQQGPVSVQILATHGPELLRGAIVTVARDRVRIRPPES